MAGPLRILAIHGLGDHRGDPWADSWQLAIRDSLPRSDQLGFELMPFSYDEIFEHINITPAESLRAFWKLARSGIGGLFQARAVGRGLVDSAQHYLKWYAGYVVAWVENDKFRTEVRKRLLKVIADEKPDVILAHSLGSLISYDALSSSDADRSPAVKRHLSKVTYVTLGSQIGNPFVVANLTPGRIEPLSVHRWYHLFNPEDDVFTAEIRLPDADNFLQVTTFFDIEGFADHAAVNYLSHRATIANVWEPLSLEAVAKTDARAATIARELKPTTPAQVRKPRKRALLVGINEYPNPEDRLAGCVNDVFLMSAVLQECGFSPSQIRVVLDERATAAGILERMSWLLDDARAGDEIVFFYSGHGAQLPTYGEGDTIDRMDETLVPHDFDWSPDTCVTDDTIYGLYSQLPFDTRLFMIFDCCHSGGIDRAGMRRVRGINPPDDIRHRALRWEPSVEMWVPRELEPINSKFTDDKDAARRFAGASGAVLRLGRAMMLRQMPTTEYNRLKRKAKTTALGPYLPVILQACQESEFSYEYRHGVESYGAFTYSMSRILRRAKRITFANLVKETEKQLAALGYDQKPAILGPGKIVNATIPWRVK